MTIPPNATTWTTRHEDRARWGDGPWTDEPDKISWTDEATGRPCLIVRGPVGALCGYVAVDPGHPLHGADYSPPFDLENDRNAMDRWEAEHGEIEVHGGLTYAAGCAHSDDEAEGICHVPEPGQPDDVWWFGFDCSHYRDLSPGIALHGPAFAGDIYRSVGYVVGQVKSLARQLAAESAP